MQYDYFLVVKPKNYSKETLSGDSRKINTNLVEIPVKLQKAK